MVSFCDMLFSGQQLLEVIYQMSIFRQAFVRRSQNKPGNTTYQRTCYKSCNAG
jgi:hypothetical protein